MSVKISGRRSASGSIYKGSVVSVNDPILVAVVQQARLLLRTAAKSAAFMDIGGRDNDRWLGHCMEDELSAVAGYCTFVAKKLGLNQEVLTGMSDEKLERLFTLFPAAGEPQQKIGQPSLVKGASLRVVRGKKR